MARVTTGEALTTRASPKASFLEELVGIILEGGDPEPREGVDELGSQYAGYAGDLGSAALEDQSELVSLGRCCQFHLPGEALGILMQGGQGAFGNFDHHTDHMGYLLVSRVWCRSPPALWRSFPGEGGQLLVSYTGLMKAAVSLPDPLFEAADELAKRLGISRSALIAVALESYLRSHQQTGVTERLNEIYRNEDSSLDPVMAAIQSASLPLDEW